jgi:16S rRNA (guanine527-N7)-methyltransferase
VLADLGMEPTPEQRDALERYLRELELWNRTRDLVKAAGASLLTRHLADSLAGLDVVRQELAAAESAAATPGRAPTVVDLGAGGGFPGIPLAVFLPGARVVLVDRSQRKCSFLRSAAAVAGLGNVTVVNAELRALAGTPADNAELVVFRAFAAVTAELAAALRGLLVPGGAVVAYKGRRANAEAEARAAEAVFPEVSLVPIEVAGLHEERTLLVLRSSRGSS